MSCRSGSVDLDYLFAGGVFQAQVFLRILKPDQSVTRPGTILSIIIGSVSALILGVGMSCTMVWTNLFALGVAVGLVGIAGIVAAYPVYNYITKKQKEKLTPEILRLSDELLK